MMGKILVVDDDENMCRLIQDFFKRRGYQVDYQLNPGEALSVILALKYQLVVLDIQMPEIDGIRLCEKIISQRPDLPVIIITAFGNFDNAVAALRSGAYNFLTKPVDLNFLEIAVRKALDYYALKAELKILNDRLEKINRFEDMIGESPAMNKIYGMIDQIAPTETAVLITGESGTGKELIARALHLKSQRKNGPLITLNASALPESLLESELFGYKKGAFTDAKEDRAGIFVQADKGTLFLDEIGDLPVSLQPKLLRVLEEKKVRPIGSSQEIEVDIRIISATNQDLEKRMAEGRFREDLYYRLNVIRIELPPLRERGNDILTLAQHFVRQFAQKYNKQVQGVLSKTAELLLNYKWPGNIRELRNTIERAVALTRFDRLAPEDLPESINNEAKMMISSDTSKITPFITLPEMEKNYIAEVIKTYPDNYSQAARVLGIDRTTLYRKIKQYQLD